MDNKIDIKLKQNWYHIEEYTNPSFGRKTNQVMDIYIDSGKIQLNYDFKLIGIRIICRNLNQNEIAFIEKFSDEQSSYFLLNLDISSLPTIWDDDEFGNFKPYKHAKIMIEYIDVSPNIKENKLLKIIPTSYESEIYLPGNIQPEFYITLPKGKEIGNNWKFIPNLLKAIFRNNIDGSALKLKYLLGETIKDIKYDGPYKNLNREKKRYSYTIESEEFRTIKDNISDVSDLTYIISFKTYFENKIILISLAPFFLLSIALVISFNEVMNLLNVNLNGIFTNPKLISYEIFTNPILNSYVIDPNFGTAYLVIILSFSLYYYSLIRDGYKIPYQSLFPYILIITIFLVLIDCFFQIRIN